MEEKKVLVIDDEDFIRELISDFLEFEGIKCDEAENSQQALALLSNNDYALILLDRHLQHQEAGEITAEIKKINTETPIVILTGDHLCNDEYLENIGANGVIFKPFKVDEFMQKIKLFLENK
jgi:DNA-binding response OmpR family regulator